VLLNVLQRRIDACTAPQLTDEQRKTWIDLLETVRQGLIDALARHALTDGPAAVAEAAYTTRSTWRASSCGYSSGISRTWAVARADLRDHPARDARRNASPLERGRPRRPRR